MSRSGRFIAACLFAIPSLLTAGTKTWIGPDTDGKWSEGANWADGTPPVSGDDLLFPAYKGLRTTINDLPSGIVLHSLTFAADVVAGAVLTVSAGIAVAPGNLVLRVPVVLAGSQTWSGGIIAEETVDLGPHTLTIGGTSFQSHVSGTGGLVVTGDTVFLGTTATYSGPTTIAPSGFLQCNSCRMISPLTVYGEFEVVTMDVASIGTLSAIGGTIRMRGRAWGSDVSLDSASQYVFARDGFFEPPELMVSGKVNLGNARFVLSGNFAPLSTVMVIANNSKEPMSGIFAGLPDGAMVNPLMKIGYYSGGDGSAVALTNIAPPYPIPTLLSFSVWPDSPQAGLPVSMYAVVSAYDAMPSGTVSFYDGGTLLASRPLDPYPYNSATFETRSLAPGLHTLTAVFTPSNGFAGSSDTRIIEVMTNETTTVLTIWPKPTYLPDRTTLTAVVAPPLHITPTGSVTFHDGGTPLVSQPLVGGVATVAVALTRGLHTISAEYVPADPGFLPSKSAADEVDVRLLPFATVTAFAATPETCRRGEAIKLMATVTSGSGAPLGSVAFVDGDTILGTEPLVGETASMSTSALAAGEHRLTASFLPMTNVYMPSLSPPVVVNVAEPPKHRAVGH